MNKLLRDNRGQATVELALVLPILMIMAIGVFEFGRAWNEKQVITDAVRQGARICAVANANRTLPANVVDTTVQNALTRASITVPNGQPEVTGFRTNTGDPCTVRVTVPFSFVFLGPVIGWVGGAETFTLASAFTMRNE